jgi:hypothetical protein
MKTLFLRGRKREVENYTVTLFPFRPDTAAVTVDDPLDDGEPHTGSLELVSAVKVLENAE